MVEPAVVAEEILDALGEPNIALTQRSVVRIGPDAALAFLAEALITEAAGGATDQRGDQSAHARWCLLLLGTRPDRAA